METPDDILSLPLRVSPADAVWMVFHHYLGKLEVFQ